MTERARPPVRAPMVFVDDLDEPTLAPHDEHTVRNELTRLARHRVLARRKKLPRLPELGIPKTRRKRNVYHYSPLWMAMPSEISQDEQTASQRVIVVASDSLDATPARGRTAGI